MKKRKSDRRFTFVRIVGAIVIVGMFVGSLFMFYSLGPKPVGTIEITNFDVLQCKDKQFSNVTCFASGQKVVFRHVFVPNPEYKITDAMRSSENVPFDYQYVFKIRENEEKWAPSVLCFDRTDHKINSNATISYISGTLMWFYNENLPDWLPYMYITEIRI